MSITVEQLQEMRITDEAIKAMLQYQEERLTYSASVELAEDIAEARPIGKEEQAGLSLLDRISYMVRNAYIFGYAQAADTLREAINATISDSTSYAGKTTHCTAKAVTGRCSGSERG